MNFYDYAKNNIPCEFVTCNCPSARSIRNFRSIRERIRKKIKNIKPYSFTYIDEEKKLAYFDVPKSASTTIRNFFFNKNPLDYRKKYHGSLDSHFKFSFVRNPWSRMVSNWKMFTTQPKRIYQLKSITSSNLNRFEDFLYFTTKVKNHHWLPQTLFIPQEVDFIGKIESFNEDIKNIFEYVQKPYKKLEKRNKTFESDFRKYYSNQTKDLVAEIYKEDIKRFKYNF